MDLKNDLSLVRSNNSGQKLKENVKRDKRKLVKHMKKNNLKMKKTHTKQEHTPWSPVN